MKVIINKKGNGIHDYCIIDAINIDSNDLKLLNNLVNLISKFNDDCIKNA